MQQQTPVQGKSENRTLMLVLSYLGLLALVPLLVEKDDSEIQWHAKHGLILIVTWIVFFIALGIVSFVLGLIPGIGTIVGVLLGCGLYPIICILILVVHILAIMKALKGERMQIPLVTEFVDKWK